MESVSMKTFAACALVSFLALSALADDHTKIIQKVDNDGEKESSVLIQTTKGAKIQPNYEITSGEEEIAGDPVAGMKEAYASWKTACADWKKELKENNKENQVLVSSCGTAKFTKDDSAGSGSGIYVYRSQAKYKLRVRVLDR